MRFANRRDLLCLGIVLLLAGLGLAVWWHYFLGPYRKVHDESWHNRHPDRELWVEVQASVRRWGWTHDDCFYVGPIGGKEWAAWLISNLPSSGTFVCTEWHKCDALTTITNHSVEGNDVIAGWVAWWERNKDKTQEEWIKDGFAQDGIVLHTPLTQEDILNLLRVLGGKSSDAKKWNAFRWLRDSDVHWRELGYTGLPKEKPDEVFDGIRLFCVWLGLYPKVTSPGVLKLGNPPRECVRPVVCEPKYSWYANLTVVGLVLAGSFCVCAWFRARYKAKTRECNPL